jgi:DNA-binding Lrp family transcriptional regulator
MKLDPTDRRILAAAAGGLPLVAHPYAELARWLGLPESVVMARMHALMAAGVIRRIAVAPNHYALGLVSNGMSVWDIEDEAAETLGPVIGGLDFVSHCYLRPRSMPEWPYNLFAMIHGASRTEVEAKRARISALLGDACRGSDVLYSTRILKKTGMRLAEGS